MNTTTTNHETDPREEVDDMELGTWEMADEEHELETSTPRVLVLDRRGDVSSELARAAENMEDAPEILRLRRPTRVVDVVAEVEPVVLVAAPEELSHAGLRRIAQVHRANPRLVIMFSPNGKPVSVAEAAECGVSDVMPWPSTRSRMRTKLQGALARAREMEAERVYVREEIVREVAAPQPIAPAVTTIAHVVTITSASGGCGKTFYATNLASYLARATNRRVLLVDLDLQFGEVAVSLRIRPDRTVSDLIEEADMASALSEYVVRHSSGYDVLCAPPDPVSAERVGPRETSALLEAAEAAYDYVVVDTPPSLNEVVLAAFDRSRSLVVMATMDVPSLRNMRVFLQTLDRLKVPSDNVSLVLNKAEDGTGIDLHQIERAYPQGFASVLPYAKEVTRSLNAGKPVIDTDPGAEVSKSFADGATKLVPPAEGVALPWTDAAPVRRSWLARLLRKGA